jgi:RNA polymerase subunit RPABC4/transcription elongation factor Spt4
MYEHYCGECHSIWFDGDSDPDSCPYCNAKQVITPTEYPAYVRVVIQTVYVD